MNVSAILASYVEKSNIGVQQEAANRFVVHALRHVIDDVFAQLSSTLVILLATQSRMMDQWFEHVLIELISTWSAVAVQMVHNNNRDPNVVRVPGRKYCNLLLVDSYASVL